MGRWALVFEPPELSDLAVTSLLFALFVQDIGWLSRHPEAPDLYKSGVRYKREQVERWLAIPGVLREGVSDCEDLACWRAAELRVRHHLEAWPFWTKRVLPNGQPLYHIRVRYPDGTIEDPSRILGMK